MKGKLKDKIKETFSGIDTKTVLINSGLLLFASGMLGYVIRLLLVNMPAILGGEAFSIHLELFIDWRTWLTGFIIAVFLWAVFWLGGGFITGGAGRGGTLFKSKADKAAVESVLENSRFLTDKERDTNFEPFTYETAGDVKKDGVPVRAVLDKKGVLQCNVMSGAHSLVVGSTGSGKTTTFINPMIQLLGASNCGSSMIISDPKGELFSLHSKFLNERGYDVLLLNLRDTYTSSRWNPLDSIWEAYQEYRFADEGLRVHRDDMNNYPDLEQINGYTEAGNLWAEWRGKAYADLTHCQDDITVAKQQIYDEMYEDLNDLISVLCPIENEKDPLWEKGARSIIMSLCLAMLEDSENPDLGMTKEKFNFFNINKALANSENNYAPLKDYFAGRSPLSQAVTMSRQVLSAADATFSSYMSIAFDKMNMFNDRGLCALTSATDIDPAQFAKRPTALFLKIPDEKDTRHGLASVFILCMYKALIKVASAREDLSLPRNVYFILDEFGNLPKIGKFDKMITVGRSRKIWFNMVVQSYTQLSNVYGEQVGDIIKSNCALKMFIGSNDLGTCKEFSELCGNMTVRTNSTSAGLGSKMGDLSVSTQTQVRPLIYPSDLQKLNNKVSTGNAIIVTFGNYPLKTQYTPSYKCPFYKIGEMDVANMRSHVFRAEQVFYDIRNRNDIVLGKEGE